MFRGIHGYLFCIEINPTNENKCHSICIVEPILNSNSLVWVVGDKSQFCWNLISKCFHLYLVNHWRYHDVSYVKQNPPKILGFLRPFPLVSSKSMQLPFLMSDFGYPFPPTWSRCHLCIVPYIISLIPWQRMLSSPTFLTSVTIPILIKILKWHIWVYYQLPSYQRPLTIADAVPVGLNPLGQNDEN